MICGLGHPYLVTLSLRQTVMPIDEWPDYTDNEDDNSDDMHDDGEDE